MMKKFLVAFILGISFSGNAQDITDWQVGFNLNPFIFSRINSDYEPQKAKQDFPNGFGFGLTIEKNWNDNWGIKTGFEYSNQNQKYDNYEFSGNMYLSTVNADFRYYKLPITLQYYFPIKENLYLTFNQGLQVSFLNDYRTVIEEEKGKATFTPDYVEYNNKINGSNNKIDIGWIYKKQTYGLIGSVGLKGFLSDKISYSTNLRYEYDLTTADNMSFTSSTGDFTPKNSTNNLRLGLELGLQYHFSINDRFNKSPHKL